MTDLRIADAPELTASEINDSLKVPTGGYGNYSITMITISPMRTRCIIFLFITRIDVFYSFFKTTVRAFRFF